LKYLAHSRKIRLRSERKRKDNVDTYLYFGDPVYTDSLKDGINDGFLTPFKVKQIATTPNEHVYNAADTLIQGEVIEIKEREANRVRIFMEQINQNEKTLVFCATQDHALAVRDLINQIKTSKDQQRPGLLPNSFRPSSPHRRSFPPASMRATSATSF
jgi:type I restriction enzyme R subunit